MKKPKKQTKFLLAAMLGIFLASCAMDGGNKEYEEGVQAYENKEYTEAAELFEKAIEKNGDRAEYYLYYGFTLIELEKYSEAAENFEKVIQDKELATVRENNKKAYRGAGIAYYLAGDDARALFNFTVAAAIEELPELDEDILTYLTQLRARQLSRFQQQNQAGEDWQSGEADEILGLYEELLKESQSPELYRLRADFYMELGQYESALDDFNHAIEAGNNQLNTLLGKYQALCALGREEESNEVIAQIARIVPEDDMETIVVAIANFRQGEYTSAADGFLKLYQSGKPEMKPAIYYLAQIAIIGKDYTSAYSYLAEYTESFFKENFSSESLPEEATSQAAASAEQNGIPWGGMATDTAGLYYQLAYCAMQLGQTEQAIEYYQKLAALQDASYLKKQEKLYIALLEQQGRWKEALERMEHYLTDYVDKENAEEYAEARKEYEFLKTR